MEGSTFSKPSKDKTYSGAPLIILWALLGLGEGGEAKSPHTVYNITWRVTNLMTGQVANSTSMLETTKDVFPTLYFDLCDLVGDSWNPSDQEPFSGYGCHHPGGRHGTRARDFYVCPGQNFRKECGGPADGYCAQWGCETTGDAYWKPSSSWDLITLKRGTTPGYTGAGPWVCSKDWCGPCYDSLTKNVTGATLGGRCNPLILDFTAQGKTAVWDGPKSWGLRLYRSGYDPVTIFSLTRQIASVSSTVAVGPNAVLSEQKPPSQPAPPPRPRPVPAQNPSTTLAPSSHNNTPTPLQGTGDRLLNLIQGAYSTLNYTSPNLTEECWLCLVSRPPYYEGVAIIGNYTNQTEATAYCTSPSQHKLTLSEVSGRGTCVGGVPKTHESLCNSTHPLQTSSTGYLVAPNGTYWACSTGLTPCVSLTVLNTTSDYCVLIELWPRVTYHTPSYIYEQFEERPRIRREPVSLTLALMLGGLTVGGIAAGVGTGTAALVETQQFQQLQAVMHTDIKALEESVSALEKSLTSLSEVFLQNRRGLDVLFLQQGGLCAALKEECCFYADHTGVVRDNMAKLRERLKQRQQLFESQQGWFEGWFNRSPWFTTLISSIMGPLIIILLILLFGPCILNRLVQFMKDRLSVIQALVLTQQYHQLKQFDPEDVENRVS
ncbi:MLV-related proviral Env polyprotein-like [Arvicola amphibius]|uniref:MLV-related proviral Env polyprotein-like n=1 Tax=Arvicola amphibius TaxID=1047088 RepID=UPI0018E37D54|nr:MLV-related proviral Env polyprotein-like [Arvicola amphibius]